MPYAATIQLTISQGQAPHWLCIMKVEPPMRQRRETIVSKIFCGRTYAKFKGLAQQLDDNRIEVSLLHEYTNSIYVLHLADSHLAYKYHQVSAPFALYFMTDFHSCNQNQLFKKCLFKRRHCLRAMEQSRKWVLMANVKNRKHRLATKNN